MEIKPIEVLEEEAWGTTTKIVAGVIAGFLVGILGTWLVLRDTGTPEEINSSTSTTTGSGIITLDEIPAVDTGTGATTGTNSGSTLAPDGAFSVLNQSAGTAVTVEKVSFGPGGGWVVVREGMMGTPESRILGAGWFGEGAWKNGMVPLLRATEAGKTYYAVLYMDGKGDKQFSMTDDMPMLSAQNGKAVEVSFVAN